jgi:hypothetical protein
MQIAGATIPSGLLTFWAIRLGHDRRLTGREYTLSAFYRRSASKPPNECDKGSVLGDLHLRSDLELEATAAWARPVLSGWVRYYGRFYPSHRGELRTIDEFIVRWAMRKYRRFRGRLMVTWSWLHALQRRNPQLFNHWSLGPMAG